MVTVHHEPPVDGSHHLERGILLVDQKTMVTRRSSDVDLQSRAGMRGLHSSKSIISSFPREKAETRNEWRFDLSPKAIGAGGISPASTFSFCCLGQFFGPWPDDLDPASDDLAMQCCIA